MARRGDTMILPLMAGLLGAIAAELQKRELEPVGDMGIRPGEQTAFDYVGVGNDDECSQAWVRLVSGAPTNSFPDQNGTVVQWNKMAFNLEVGLMRCVPTGEPNNPPSLEEYYAAADDQLADMAAMRTAICNYLHRVPRDFVLGIYTPYGPMGGVAGGSWQVQVHWMNGEKDEHV